MFDFLGRPVFALAYYLFTFFAIEAALVIALGQWRRSASFRAYRLTLAFGSLTFLRVLLVILIAIGTNSSQIANVWVPPFERFVAISSLGILIWAFTPYFRENELVGNVIVVLNTVFALIFYFLAVFFWSGNNFNQSSWEIFFVIFWQMPLALFGIVNCGMKLDDERTMALFGFLSLFIGYLLHIFLASNYVQPHDPVLVRIAEMAAYPFFAAAVYQGAIYSLSVRSKSLARLA